MKLTEMSQIPTFKRARGMERGHGEAKHEAHLVEAFREGEVQGVQPPCYLLPPKPTSPSVRRLMDPPPL